MQKFKVGNIYDLDITIENQRYYKDGWGSFTFTINNDDNLVYRLCGECQELRIGQNYLLKGKYEVNQKYGDQFSPIVISAVIPDSLSVKMNFLTGFTTKEIASQILSKYPDIINDVAKGKYVDIDYDEIKGIGKKSWSRIRGRIIENFGITNLISYLSPFGITFKVIKQLLEYIPDPNKLECMIRENPYLLTNVRGISFGRADEIALKLNPDLINSDLRCCSYLKEYLKNVAETDGHTYIIKEELMLAVADKIPECIDVFDPVLNDNKEFYIDGNCIGIKALHDMEFEVYEKLLMKANEESVIKFTEEEIQKAIQVSEEEQGFKYVESQLKTIKKSLEGNLAIISGAAGTGKSSIMRAILNAYKQKNVLINCCALSAMAAARITEATGMNASTIHRTLQSLGTDTFLMNEYNKLSCGVLFLDEASMVNTYLFVSLLRAIDKKTKLIIVGDHRQLPPIGYGNIFTDILERLPDKNVSQLIEPMRQAKESGILMDANQIRIGDSPIKGSVSSKIVHGNMKDMFYWFVQDSSNIFNNALSLYYNAADKFGFDEVVLACPRKKDCIVSTYDFNREIQEHYLGAEKQEISYGDRIFKKGAKVMQIVNDYDNGVFNGDMGYIESILYNKNGKAESCSIVFGDKTIDYLKTDLGAIDLAYAMTVHKLQGSGRHTIIGVLDMKHYRLLDNCMLYTLITRAKKECYLISNASAFQQCIINDHTIRNTWLSKIK